MAGTGYIIAKTAYGRVLLYKVLPASMNRRRTMGFYEEIAPYYDDIFPAGEEQLKLIADIAGKPPKKILDIACGTGTYSLRLAQEGYEIWAVDSDSEMIGRAVQKANEQHIMARFFVSNMQTLDLAAIEQANAGMTGYDGKSTDKDAFGQTGIMNRKNFDCVFCIGNSIVHLGNTEAILEAVKRMKAHLAPQGDLLLQIINFDRILEKGITSLPTIRNDEKGIIFHRNYTRDQHTGLIYFDTILTAEKDGCHVEYSNRVELFPLTSSMLKSILKDAGFDSIDFFGDFNKKEYNSGSSYMLVALAY